MLGYVYFYVFILIASVVRNVVFWSKKTSPGRFMMFYKHFTISVNESLDYMWKIWSMMVTDDLLPLGSAAALWFVVSCPGDSWWSSPLWELQKFSWQETIRQATYWPYIWDWRLTWQGLSCTDVVNTTHLVPQAVKNKHPAQSDPGLVLMKERGRGKVTSLSCRKSPWLMTMSWIVSAEVSRQWQCIFTRLKRAPGHRLPETKHRRETSEAL